MKKNVILVAKKYYRNLPYHNFSHALKVINNSKKFISLLEKNKKKIDKEALYHAILFHDAAYYEFHKKKGFRDKESLSASIARKELKKLGYPREHIKKVVKIILTTKVNAKLKTLEEKIIRASDLRGLQGSYKKFKRTSLDLKAEFELLNNKKISKGLWQEMSKIHLKKYLKEKIILSKKFYDKKGKSRFHSKAERNLNKFIKE